tara:strand:+ start:60206 stop:60406 length:201 start_codon:yes stop_codon:yes gene_type:complete
MNYLDFIISFSMTTEEYETSKFNRSNCKGYKWNWKKFRMSNRNPEGYCYMFRDQPETACQKYKDKG